MDENENITGTGNNPINPIQSDNEKETEMTPEIEETEETEGIAVCIVCLEPTVDFYETEEGDEGEGAIDGECGATMHLKCAGAHMATCEKCRKANEEANKEPEVEEPVKLTPKTVDDILNMVAAGKLTTEEGTTLLKALTSAPARPTQKKETRMEKPKVVTTLEPEDVKLTDGTVIQAYTYTQAMMVIGVSTKQQLQGLIRKGAVEFAGFRKMGAKEGAQDGDNRIVGLVTVESVEKYKAIYRPREGGANETGTHSYELKMRPEEVVDAKLFIREHMATSKEATARFEVLLDALVSMKDLSIIRKAYNQKHYAHKKATQKRS